MAEFKKGDLVQLKSGGPIMTVQEVGAYSDLGIQDGVNCAWFDAKNTPMNKVFDSAMLKLHKSRA